MLLTFVDDLYEDRELWYPKLRCEEARHKMRRVAPEKRWRIFRLAVSICGNGEPHPLHGPEFLGA